MIFVELPMKLCTKERGGKREKEREGGGGGGRNINSGSKLLVHMYKTMPGTLKLVPNANLFIFDSLTKQTQHCEDNSPALVRLHGHMTCM